MITKLANGQECWLAVISAGRAANISLMEAKLGHPATWYVPPQQVRAYQLAGAANVKDDGGGLCRARNRAIADAFWGCDLPCVQVSDDLKRAQVAKDGKGVDCSMDTVLGTMLERLTAPLEDAKLAGIAPTNNAYFSRGKAARGLFIIGDCFAVAPHGHQGDYLQFDESLPLKEDYDYTAQHLARFGTVLRCDDLLLTFEHYKNAGGAVDRRTVELEEEVIGKLLAKWPQYIKRHPRREHEVLLRAPHSSGQL